MSVMVVKKSERQMVKPPTYAKYGYKMDKNNIKITKINHYFQQKNIVKQQS
jgi:hypothetical protein